jgi:hypothetical protein
MAAEDQQPPQSPRNTAAIERVHNANSTCRPSNDAHRSSRLTRRRNNGAVIGSTPATRHRGKATLVSAARIEALREFADPIAPAGGIERDYVPVLYAHLRGSPRDFHSVTPLDDGIEDVSAAKRVDTPIIATARFTRLTERRVYLSTPLCWTHFGDDRYPDAVYPTAIGQRAVVADIGYASPKTAIRNRLLVRAANARPPIVVAARNDECGDQDALPTHPNEFSTPPRQLHTQLAKV